MTAVNSLLLDPYLRGLLWTHLNISSSVPFPIIEDNLLYGVLSSTIHNTNLRVLSLGLRSDQAFTKFFTYLGDSFNTPVKYYDEMMAASGESIVLGANTEDD